MQRDVRANFLVETFLHAFGFLDGSVLLLAQQALHFFFLLLGCVGRKRCDRCLEFRLEALEVSTHLGVVRGEHFLAGDHLFLGCLVAIRKFPRSDRVVTGRMRLRRGQAATKNEGAKELLHESNPRVMNFEWVAILEGGSPLFPALESAHSTKCVGWLPG